MTASLYCYQFDKTVSPEDIASALLLAIWGCEALHGEAQTRLDAAHCFYPEKRACVIDATTLAGRDFNRLFVGFVTREIDAEAFSIRRVTIQVAA
jgi:hypothetical protein